MKCAIVTNIPVPYRNPIWSLLPRHDYRLIFCARSEGNRDWRLPPPNCDHVFLAENVRSLPDGYNFVHNNPDVWGALNSAKPQVVVTTGLNPTHLYAMGWAKVHRAAHVYMTDGTELSEKNIGWKHRLLRKLIIRGTAAGVAASLSGKRLLEGYGLPSDRIFLSRLCADNARFTPLPLSERPYDVMFCGQLHERKLPYFFVETCAEIRRRRGACRALVIGSGPERSAVLEALRNAGITLTAPGFIQPEHLADWYPRARLLLFPTRLDPWGVVANEAMASGTPVITMPTAGVAADLVIDHVNGRIVAEDVQAWATACVELLDNASRWKTFSTRALHDVQAFNYADAAEGLQAACDRAALRG